MKKHPLRILTIIGFIFSLYSALVLYSTSSFLNQFAPESLMGLLYTGGAIVSIVGLLLIPKLIARFGSRLVMMCLVLLVIIICLINAFASIPALIMVAFCLSFGASGMFYLSNDILIDQVADNHSMGRIRGGYLTALSAAYVIAPTVTGFILARMGFSALYTIAALLLVPLLVIIIHSRSSKQVHSSKINIFTSLQALTHDRDLRNITIANFILQFFYAWMVIYTPIYLHEQLGIPWDSIGTIFSIMLFAFVLTEIPFGRMADKVFGERRMLIAGLVMMGTATSLLFFMPYFTLPLLAFILFCTRIGASCIEVMTESYFFKRVPAEDTGEVSIFRNMYPLAYIVAPLLAAPIIRFLPPQYLFLILGIIVVSGIVWIIPIKDVAK